jgi:hypothetical protein
MKVPILNKVQSVSRLLPYLSYCIGIDIDKLVILNKQKMVHDLIEKYPTITYCEITFDLQKASGAELNESVENFKCADGRYIYDGNVVSRGFIADKLSKNDTKLIMTAWIKESEGEG